MNGIGVVGAEKSAGYRTYPRDEVVALVPAGCGRVLDVGCAAGVAGERLKRERGCVEVVGIEKDPAAAAQARHLLDQVIEADVATWAPVFRDRTFDCLVYADVLEHLADPWTLLRSHARLLRKGGSVVVSLPNVRYYPVVWGLIRGRWEYGAEGVLDSTHLRFFTLAGMRRIIREAGFSIEVERPVPCAPAWLLLANRLALGAFSDLLARQYVFRATNG